MIINTRDSMMRRGVAECGEWEEPERGGAGRALQRDGEGPA